MSYSPKLWGWYVVTSDNKVAPQKREDCECTSQENVNQGFIQRGGAWDPPLCEIRKCPCLFCLGSSVAQIGPLLAAPLGTVGTSCAPLGPPPLFAPLRTLIYRISSNLSDTFNYPGHSFEQFSLF